jgi:prepilin-type N-terminal cleavage/methylation domain-containing protein/prepilin-type processing-associated H-X9-DG protein
MTIRRFRGFTLIELLVVIAIIGILAAMLFPVFARARESARKIQCLSNMKNIAIAYQMYLADYDAFPPGGHDQETADWFQSMGFTGAGGGSGNPFLTPFVILDEYIRNRDVWTCPSATATMGPVVIVPVYGGTYLDTWRAHADKLAGSCYERLTSQVDGVYPCSFNFPPGWGGTITDSFTQGMVPGGLWGRSDEPFPGIFTWSIGPNIKGTRDLKETAIADPASFVVAGEGGLGGQIEEVSSAAWPKACLGSTDWSNCPWTRDCSVADQDCGAGALAVATGDDETMKRFTLHLGGSNLAFADGHAKWMPARQIWNPSAFDKHTAQPVAPTPQMPLAGLRVLGPCNVIAAVSEDCP